MKILHIITSSRGNESQSIKLGNAITEKLQSQHPGSTLTVLDLTKNPFPHLEEVHLASFFTPKEQHSAELAKAVANSDAAIAQLFDSDMIVIGMPMYNFSIPSVLKAWIDHIARIGVTFRYTEKGPIGLVNNKKVYLAISSGGVYSEGFLKQFDFTENYLRAVLGFLGMTDISTFRVEGNNIPELKASALPTALEQLGKYQFA